MAYGGYFAVPGPELPDKPQDAGWKCPGNGHFLVCIHDSGHYNPRGRKYVYPVVRRAHYRQGRWQRCLAHNHDWYHCALAVLVQGTRKVPVQYAKRVIGNKQYGGARQYIPLKLFAANVMPIIFAQALMFIPLAIVQYSTPENSSWFVRSLMDHRSLLYNVVFALLIIAFTYFYTAITLNPTQMAEDMKRNNGFIPGVKPGKDTAEYIDTVMSRITFPGSLFIAFIAIMPALAGLLNVQDAFSQFFGGTSLLILIGVVLDTLQQIESHLMMRHYDGLLNSGRVHGRGGVSAY